MGADLNYRHDTRGTSGGGVFQTGSTVTIPFTGAGSNKDIFNYIGTQRLTLGYTNPVYSGAGWRTSGVMPYPIQYRIHATSYANYALAGLTPWTTAGYRPTPGAGVGYIDHNIYDFMGSLCTYKYQGKTVNDSCLVQPSVVAVYMTDAEVLTAFVWGSNNGVTWTQLGQFSTVGATGWKLATCNATKYYRYIRVGSATVAGGNAIQISTIEMYGSIKYIR